MANQLGKRYTCEACNATYLVVKSGVGVLECHGKPAIEKAAKPLPSSD